LLTERIHPQNIVAHVEVPVGEGGSLDLEAMYSRLNLHCTYQKNMFPGLIYRPHASPVVLLCFFSGKIVITGGKTERDVMEGWRRLWPTLRVFVSGTPAVKRQRVIEKSEAAADI
jgi:transcription initiation factor TFIID TATA-box-binding protein